MRTGVSQAVRNEEIKLIERVFLMPDQQVPQVVVSCGIDGRGGTAGICARAGRNLAEHTGMPVCLIDADPEYSFLAVRLPRDGQYLHRFES